MQASTIRITGRWLGTFNSRSILEKSDVILPRDLSGRAAQRARVLYPVRFVSLRLTRGSAQNPIVARRLSVAIGFWT